MAKVALSYGHGANTYEEKRSKFVVVGGQVYEEHTHNAEVGQRVNRILQAHGVQTLVVQPPYGNDVPLETRTDQANAWGADLYWSIHANAGDPSARGWCGFYWSGSAQGERIAKLYAKHVSALGLPLYSGDGIYPSLRGTWSDFHELRETLMISLITENGFMTNAADFEYIFKNKDGHWDRLSYAHSKAILEYFGIVYDPYKSGEFKLAPQPDPTQPAPTNTFLIKVIVEDLWYYNKPDWNAKVALVHAGDVFTVVETLMVNGSKMYKLKSGTYITANPKYVQVL